MAKQVIPTCMHCGRDGVHATGKDVYPHRPDLHSKKFYRCPDCPDTFIGCHRTGRALGPVMANKATRQARLSAHNSFDKLWKLSIVKSRSVAYSMLAEFLGVDGKDAHIGHLDESRALSVAEWADGLMARSRAEGWIR